VFDCGRHTCEEEEEEEEEKAEEEEEVEKVGKKATDVSHGSNAESLADTDGHWHWQSMLSIQEGGGGGREDM